MARQKRASQAAKARSGLTRGNSLRGRMGSVQVNVGSVQKPEEKPAEDESSSDSDSDWEL